MPAEMKCNMCGVTLRVQADQVGSIINCPSCGQVIFVQLPSEPRAASDTAPESQETLAVHSGPPESEVPDFLKSAETPAPAAAPAELAPQSLAETDTVSSLAEMFGGEEPGSAAPARDSLAPHVVPQPDPGIDLSFLTPKLDTPISLDSAPPAPTVPASPAGTGAMPWESPTPAATPEPSSPSIFEAAEKTAAIGTSPAVTIPPDRLGAAEFPWLPGGASEPAEVTSPAPSPFDFTAPVAPSQQPATSAASPAPPISFVPPVTPSLPPGQPEFFLPGTSDEPVTPAATAISGAAARFTGSAAAAPAKPQSRLGILVATYVSGVIFGLIIGKFVFGKPAAAASGSSGLEAVRDDGMYKDKTKWVDPKASVPSSQLKRMGETVQIAGLSITARSVQRAKVTKVHSFGGSKETSAGECLVLHLLLKNTSKDVEFAPLDPMFVRPHNPRERPTYTYIEVRDGEPIGMFDLHKFSEFDLEGQPFDAIRPGEELEAIIAAAEDSPSKAKGKMCWRVQVRAGVPDQKPEKNAYTTVVGFEFTPEQIRG
jgi:DNA-directed RNA polymerase subunit RPC12/RpoP